MCVITNENSFIFCIEKMTQMIQINKMANRKIFYKLTYSNTIMYSGEIKT